MEFWANTMQLQLADYCANKSSNDDFGNNNAIMQSNIKRKVIKGSAWQ